MGRNWRSEDMGMVRWQNSKARRTRPRLGPGAILAVAVAAPAVAVVAAQGLGWLHLPGWTALVPAGLALVALSAQLVAAARAALAWLGG
jgi:hypothetical protein